MPGRGFGTDVATDISNTHIVPLEDAAVKVRLLYWRVTILTSLKKNAAVILCHSWSDYVVFNGNRSMTS